MGDEPEMAVILRERNSTHGDFSLNACISQSIKSAMAISPPIWREIDAVKREALEMIALKISRICSGSPDHADHWQDIIGYASLGLRSIHPDKSNPDRP